MSSNLLSETQAEYQGTLSVGMLLTSYYAAPQVKVADTCPCNYAANAESNKRWCCGDYPHLDLSQWALEKVCRFSAAQQQGHVWRSCIQTCWRGLCLASRCCCMPLV